MLCSICELKPAKYQCKLCGRYVCEDDYEKDKGICSICNNSLCQICGKHLSIGYCKICGRIGCEDCLIQVSLTEFICIECMRNGRYRL